MQMVVAQSAAFLIAFLQRGKTPTPNECPGYDTKQSDGKVPARPGMVAPDKGPINGLNRTNGTLMLNWIVWLNWIAWNRNVFDN